MASVDIFTMHDVTWRDFEHCLDYHSSDMFGEDEEECFRDAFLNLGSLLDPYKELFLRGMYYTIVSEYGNFEDPQDLADYVEINNNNLSFQWGVLECRYECFGKRFSNNFASDFSFILLRYLEDVFDCTFSEVHDFTLRGECLTVYGVKLENDTSIPLRYV